MGASDTKAERETTQEQHHGPDPIRAQRVPASLAEEAALEQLVLQTLQSRLDPQHTNEYRRAMEVVPDIVERECRVMDFLRTEGFNVTAAAERIARYWKIRKLVFGFDRWLMPLTIQLLRTGY